VEKRDVLALAGYRLLGLDLPRARDLGPIAVIWLLSLAILVLQRDLGTSLLFFGLFVMLLYVSTERPGWAVLGTLLFAGGAYFGYLTFSHVKVRVGAWLDPFSDYDAYYQVINAQFGMAWGGLLGTGLGLGRPGLTPLARSDFIAAAIGEELGMTGLMAVIMIYGLIVARGLRAALQCREPFGKLLAAGLSFAFALQVFTILGGVTRLLPLTGLTTPFMSQGGSSLVSNWVVMALLLVISHQVRKPAVTVTPLDPDAQATQLMKAAA
jgi:cell division protein FtsW (lipid II flippase)